MGSWVWNLAKANFGDIEIEKFGNGDGPYCFEKAVVMRHDIERIGELKKLRVFDLLRCKARKHCGMDPLGRRKEMTERGLPIIRLILLMRRGARSFKNAEVVRAMTNTDNLVSPHGAQHTNMLFMDRGSSVVEFFPKGWLETAGTGQYVFLWMADQSGVKHQGAWRGTVGQECPNPKHEWEWFLFHKNNKVGHNETYFAEWARKVLNDVRVTKLEQASKEQARVQVRYGSGFSKVAVSVHVHQVSFDRLQGNSMRYRCYVAVGFHVLPLFSAHLNSAPGGSASVMFCSTSGPFKLAGMDIFLKVSAAYGFVKG
ncbi:hypothetical protein Vadar_016599 [Vaccinium darrowii]|uniref:Uncharacterized protein n=1 Tax=Vaccinium darrowii TaxID=229202 RepID=A0ACB7Y7G9_9ERIC|nr:hypothetical protein Vadar_016599 [Vaccinium darrowii]